MTDLPRVPALDGQEFLDEHLVARRPVVVTGEAASWPALRRWSWARLTELFGDRMVDLYDDWFLPTGVASFADFVSTSIGASRPDPARCYVRWFARHRPDAGDSAGAGRWADDVFAELAPDWVQPSFLPTSDYVVPYAPSPATVDAVRDAFPYRGLFVSATGARTRLHRDPWASSAVLCQVAGTKRVWMYAPAQQAQLLAAVASGAGPNVLPACDGLLSPGEVLFVPDGWWHHVTTLSDSVSITWNFVHASVAERLQRHAADLPDDPELAVVEYFLAGAMGRATTGRTVADLVAAARHTLRCGGPGPR